MTLSQDFISLLQDQLGDESQALLNALNTPSPVSVRLNPAKPATSVCGTPIKGLTPVPWCPNAYYLSTRPQFTLDPALHQGRYYVQEASSMLLWQALEQYVGKDACILDVCAAPGGKSTLAAAYLDSATDSSVMDNPESAGFLLSNEPIHPRDYILLENCTKWGFRHHAVCSQYPQQFGRGLWGQFDCLIVDAPCSGEGMFRKEQKAVEDWSLQNVQDCVARQREILTAVLPLLKPSGILIYSTCTYNRHEDEEQVLWLQQQGLQPQSLQLNEAWGIVETHDKAAGTVLGYHCYPHRVQGEGFFLSVLLPSKSWDKSELGSDPNSEKRWDKLTKCIRLLHADELQTEACLNKTTAYPRWEVDRETALQYLRQEALRLDMGDTPKGLVLLTYEGYPLGFVKHIGSRQNNLYPKEWRIRHL